MHQQSSVSIPKPELARHTPGNREDTPQMRPPPLHRFLEQPAFNHHHYPGRPSSFGGTGGNNGLGSNGIGTGSTTGSGGGSSGGGGIGVGAGSGGTGLGSGNGKSSSVNYSSTGSGGLHSHHHHHHHHHGGTGGNGTGTGGNMTINTSTESSSDYKPNLALSGNLFTVVLGKLLRQLQQLAANHVIRVQSAASAALPCQSGSGEGRGSAAKLISVPFRNAFTAYDPIG
uniref:Uncharacterized protein n=1 Tax=Anopheles culicifacies TaxID=139723 RepID=A0A182LY70_9DIPT